MMLRSVLAVFLLLIAGSAPAPAGAQNVQSHCASVGDDDHAKPAPAALIPEARRIFAFSPETPNAVIKKGTVFRCMGGEVWLCNYGANLVCGKANASSTSVGAASFCKQNPGSDVVPMAATGHDTIFEWKCVGTEAQISQQIETVDPRGFIAENWKRLK